MKMKMKNKVRVRLYNLVWEGTNGANMPKELMLAEMPKKVTVDEAVARLFGKKVKLAAYDMEIVGVNNLKRNPVVEYVKAAVRAAAVTALVIVAVNGAIGVKNITTKAVEKVTEAYGVVVTTVEDVTAGAVNTFEGIMQKVNGTTAETAEGEATEAEEVTAGETVLEAAETGITETEAVETETRIYAMSGTPTVG